MNEGHNISIVMQGQPVKSLGRDTFTLAKNIKDWFGGPLILSTWNEAVIPEGHSFDAVIRSRDPGSVLINGRSSNVNRQIVSTMAGLLTVKTDFAIKIRTDCLINIRDPIIEDLIKIEIGNLITFNVTAKDPTKCGIHSHFSDWVVFGRRSDLLNLFEIDLQKEGSMLSAEQHIFSSFARKITGKKLSIEACHDVLLNSVRIWSFKKIGLSSIKIGYSRIPFGINGLHGYLCGELEKKSPFVLFIERCREVLLFSLIQVILKIKSLI